MSDPLEEFAQLLDVLDIGTYQATGTGGSVFLGELPDTPDLAVAIATYPGGEADARLGYDDLRVQFKIRGPHGDYRTGRALARRIYDDLHGMPSRYLPGGTWMVDLIGQQSGPIDLGKDAKHRPEWAVNFRTELRNESVHRA